MKRHLAFALLFFFGSLSWVQAQEQNRVVIRGTESTVAVAQRWAKSYQAGHGNAIFDINVSSEVGAATAARDGKADIAQRLASGSAGKKITTGERLELPVGVTAVVIYVHKGNPVRALSLDQLRKIYLGELTNWKSVGGPNLPIHLYSCESAIAGSTLVRDSLMEGREFYDVMQGFGDPARMLAAMAIDTGAIGFGPLFQSPEVVHAVALRQGNLLTAVEANPESIRSLRYPLSRTIVWTVSKRNSAAGQFCKWVVSSDGQAALNRMGYFQLESVDAARAVEAVSGL